MNRRTFMTGAAMATAATAGCLGIGEEESAFPSYGVPVYGDWVSEDTDGSEGVFFSHIDWAATGDDDEEESDVEDDVTEIVEEVPILGLPLYGGMTSSLALFGIMFYPFAEDVLPEEGIEVEGIETESMTWIGDVLVFHGSYEPEAFEDRYAEGFERADDRDGYAIFVGADDSTEGSAYAVSEETLVVGMEPGSDQEYVPEDVVTDAIDRTVEETDRVVDTEEGQWLFETTGESRMAFGAWEADDFTGALEDDTENGQDGGDEPDPEIEDNPVFDDVTSLVNTVAEVEDGETTEMEARFSAIYPDDGVPSEDELVEHLVGEDVPHEITIEDERVSVVATFEEDALEE